jgi:hypothetical protein
MYTVNDVNQLCFGSQMITLWGADISPGTDFPAADAGPSDIHLLSTSLSLTTGSTKAPVWADRR